MADVAPLRAAHEPRLPDRERREVVVVHEAAVLLAGEVVDLLPLLHRPEREQRHDLRLATREEPGAVCPRADRHLCGHGPDLLLGASVRTALVHGDLLADEVLVDRLGRALDVLLRLRVLDRGLAFGRRRADRERELDLFQDAVEEEVPLRRAELLGVLLGVRQLTEVGEELLAKRALDCGRAATSRGSWRSSRGSALASSCPPRSKSSTPPVRAPPREPRPRCLPRGCRARQSRSERPRRAPRRALP